MFAGKTLRCDCGYEVRASAEAARVDAVRRHAWEAHGISFSSEEALAVLLRMELEKEVPDDLVPVDHASHRKGQR